MSKYIQEMQNKYSRGHEQMEKRPYLVVYDSDDYVLGFPLTTKNKKTKPYPSHKNPTVSVDKISDIISEVMIDQLQFIYKNDFTNGLVISFLKSTSGSIRIRYVTPAITRI